MCADPPPPADAQFQSADRGLQVMKVSTFSFAYLNRQHLAILSCPSPLPTSALVLRGCIDGIADTLRHLFAVQTSERE